MSQVNTVICDMLSCKRLKGETNHWWALTFWPIPNDKDNAVYKQYGVTMGKFEKIFPGSAEIDICSEQCLMKAEQRIREGLDPRG